jgi:hypothetical protein
MKNIIYILIFLPSLLFSQETKNMEFVGVRNIEFIPTSQNQELIFNVDSNVIMKINSLSCGVMEGLAIYDFSESNTGIKVALDGGLMFETYSNTSDLNNKMQFPFYLNSGSHTLTVQSYQYQSRVYKVILYGLEFKLTTP